MIVSYNLLDSGYCRDEGSGVWAKQGFYGIAYSDGDEIENRISCIINKATDLSVFSQELRDHCTDWATLYHLSARRVNIMRPFKDILHEAHILEVGAGCGAITRYLGESGAKVLALEGSHRRAGIARSRTRDLSNVAVICESFEQFKCDQQFDVITLIGVLEYANLFIGGKYPAAVMLERARSFLKPNGKLIIAIENQLGLKYFAGAPEDHVGIPMYGIEELYRDEQPKTYGRKELSGLIHKAGFASTKFFASFPDYKLPVSIITELGFSCNTFDAAALVWKSIRQDPQLPPIMAFSPELVWPSIINNELALDLANSFLIVASPAESESLVPSTTLAWHFTTDRRKELCKITEFVQVEANQVEVRYKRPDPNAASPVAGSLLQHYLPERAEYTKGKVLSYKLIRILTRDGWRTEEVCALLRDWLDFLATLAAEKGQTVDLASPSSQLPGIFFDCTPQNIIISDDGGFRVIDDEWTANEKLEVGYIIFRSLLGLFSTVTKYGRPAQNIDTTFRGLLLTILNELGLSISNDAMARYLTLESRFQTEISGRFINPEDVIVWLKNTVLPMNNLSQAVAERDAQIAERDAQLVERNAQLAERDAQLQSLLTSRSWRVTSPLRAGGQIYRKGRYNLRKIQGLIKTFGLVRLSQKTFEVIQSGGLGGLVSRYKSYGFTVPGNDYGDWVRRDNIFDDPTSDTIRYRIALMDTHPLISVVMPVYNPEPRLLSAAIESVRNQLYPYWELCIADDASTNEEIRPLLESVASKDKRLKVVFRKENGNISRASNSALELASGEFVAFLDNDDLLSLDALFEVAHAIAERPDTDAVYTDQDKVDLAAQFSESFYKPDFSPEYFRGVMYVGHLLVVRRGLAMELNGFDPAFDTIQDYEFMLRVSERSTRIRHVPKVLYHWRKVPGSYADSLSAKLDNDKLSSLQEKAVNAHLERLGIQADAKRHPSIPHRVMLLPRPGLDTPQISVIIPTLGADHLDACLESLFLKSTYKNLDIILVDNNPGSGLVEKRKEKYPSIRIIPCDEPFNFARLNNLAVGEAKGKYLLLLNDDTELVEADSLRAMAMYLAQDDVGVVGPLLLYPDFTVQHAGVVLGLRGTADHVMRGFPKDSDGYAGSLSCAREVSAVTAACLMVRKADYFAVGGMKEDYTVVYQDVDFCLRLRELGRRNIYTPRAVFLHHESKSRGKEYPMIDRALLLDCFGRYIRRGDPYYNPNFSLMSCDSGSAKPLFYKKLKSL